MEHGMQAGTAAGWSVGEIVYVGYLALVALAWVILPMIAVLIGR